MRLGLLSPFGQQNVTDFGMAGLAVQRETGPFGGADPPPPVLAAWIKGIEPDIDPAREFAQQGKMKRRNRRQWEHMQPLWPLRARNGCGVERSGAGEKGKQARRCVLRRGAFSAELPPQLHLPLFIVPVHGIGAL